MTGPRQLFASASMVIALLAAAGGIAPSPARALSPALDRDAFGTEVAIICDRASSELLSLKDLDADAPDTRESFVAYFSGLDRILVRLDTKLTKLRIADAGAKAVVASARAALAYERKILKAGLARGRTKSVASARSSIDDAYVEIDRRELAVNAQLVALGLDECSFFPSTSPDTAAPAPTVFGLDPGDAAMVLPAIPGFTLTVLPPESQVLPLDDAGLDAVERFDGRVIYGDDGKLIGTLVALKLRPGQDGFDEDSFFEGVFGAPPLPALLVATGAFRRVRMIEGAAGLTAAALQGRWAVIVVADSPTIAKQFVSRYLAAVPVLPAPAGMS